MQKVSALVSSDGCKKLYDDKYNLYDLSILTPLPVIVRPFWHRVCLIIFIITQFEGGKTHMILRENLKAAVVNNPENVARLCREILSAEQEIDQEKEHFWVMGLSTRNQVKYIELVSLGTLNSSLVHPRETFRLAILKAVSSVILCHNHPSGVAEPSDEDRKLTERLVATGRIIDIRVLDHVILGDGVEFTSFRELGLM